MLQGDTFGFMLVFGLSSRRNLECVYCNANAGPHGFRPTLDPRTVEKWVEAFGSFEPSIMLFNSMAASRSWRTRRLSFTRP